MKAGREAAVSHHCPVQTHWNSLTLTRSLARTHTLSGKLWQKPAAMLNATGPTRLLGTEAVVIIFSKIGF